MNGQTNHFFLALPIPNETASQLERTVKEKSQELFFKTWVHPEDYHITLHFLGSASKEQLQKLDYLLPDFIKNWKSFALEITHFGSFGEEKSPRILWAGVREESTLFSLQKEMGTICKEAGFVLERRPYRPHITVARKWVGEAFYSPGLLPSPLILADSAWKWQVEEVRLYQTHLDRLPKYEAIYRYPLS